MSDPSSGNASRLHRARSVPGSKPDRPRVRAYVALGANLGDAAATMAWAVQAIDHLPMVRVRAVSRLYATEPWGVVDQPEFRNAVVAIDVVARGRVPATDPDTVSDPEAAALALLAQLKQIERGAGRRPGRRWGPRELDLDLLVFGRHRISVDRPEPARSVDSEVDPARALRPLVVPHRDAGERLFVLAPLADLAPRLVPPGWAKTVATRRDQVAASEPTGSVRAIGTWDAPERRWV